MKYGIYEKLLNNELKSKLNNEEYFWDTDTLFQTPEKAKK